MTAEGEVRSLGARVARLAEAVEKATAAQVESAQWCAEILSDMAGLKAEVMGLKRAVSVLSAAFVKLNARQLQARDELRTTAAYPVAAGVYDDDISRMASEGSTVSEIAGWIGCAKGTVKRRMAVIGVATERSRPKWTEREVARLEAAARSCSTWGEVAEEVPGRTEAACAHMAHKLGFSLAKAPRPWTAEDDARLSELWNDGRSDVRDIAAELGRTEAAARNRAHTLGITNRGRKHAVTKRNMDRFWVRGSE